MATDGPLDIVQYDIFSYGFMAWVVLGPQLDAAGARLGVYTLSVYMSD